MLNLGRLKKHERLVIDRRRREETQAQAAARYKVSLYAYRQWEENTNATGMPNVRVGRLAAYEACYMRRRRSGVRVKDLAIAMGLSRWWVIQMETGQATDVRLVEYWEAN